MTTRPTDEEIRELIKRLRAPAYWFIAGFDNRTGHWFSGSSAGHEGENDQPSKAADVLEAWLAERQAARDGVTDEMVDGICRSLTSWWNLYHENNKALLREKVRAVLQSIAQPENNRDHCQCIACINGIIHDSDCAVHNEPAMPISPCDCSKRISINAAIFAGNLNLYQRETLFRAALQSIALPITSVSDALNFLEKWALGGGKLSGGDVQRFHATVERIAPVEQSARVSDEKSEVWVVQDETGCPIYCASYAQACHEHINDAINEHGIEEACAWKVIHYENSTSPKPQQAVPDGWVDELQLIGAVLHGYSPSIARDDAIRAVRKLLSTAPVYNGRKEG